MSPIIFSTKYFTLHSLWLFFLIALIVGTYTFIRLSINNRLKLQFISENGWKMILVSLIGARIFAILGNLNIYFYELGIDPFLNLFKFWDRGLSIWGAIFFGLGYLYLLCKKNEDQNFYKWLDVFVPSIIMGLAIAHVGAFFDGTNHGRETELPWGVNFENPAIKYAVPIHPTQIYAFLYSQALSIGLIQLSHKYEERPGLIGFSGITIYAFLYFLEQFFRGDDVWTIYGIRLPQILALVICILGATILYKRYKK